MARMYFLVIWIEKAGKFPAFGSAELICRMSYAAEGDPYLFPLDALQILQGSHTEHLAPDVINYWPYCMKLALSYHSLPILFLCRPLLALPPLLVSSKIELAIKVLPTQPRSVSTTATSSRRKVRTCALPSEDMSSVHDLHTVNFLVCMCVESRVTSASSPHHNKGHGDMQNQQSQGF